MDVIYFKLHIFKHLIERWFQRHIVCFGPLIWSQPAVCVAFPADLWIIHPAPGVYLFISFGPRRVCLCWRKAACRCSREITSFHNKKCWGVCVVYSAAQERRCAVRGTLLMAEMLQRQTERRGRKKKKSSMSRLPEASWSQSCFSSQTAEADTEIKLNP